MLYSVADGDYDKWSKPQLERFIVGFIVMLMMGFISIDFWRACSPFLYLFGIILLLCVLFIGDYGGGAKRWLEFGTFRFQPSEIMKVGLIMFLSIYYDWLKPSNTSKLFWVIIPLFLIILPAALIIPQPDLGTGTIIIMTGFTMMFAAGVHFIYFIIIMSLIPAFLALIFLSRGTNWQLVTDYQFNRIDTFLNPEKDPLGDG